jgi:NAD(P)-dependent dehydrogenase (short-subunit alcohol dehydrogenase family)
VTVNAVLPGPTWTDGPDGYVGEMARNNRIDDAEMERLVFTVGRPTSLLQRFATPEEVAHMILASSIGFFECGLASQSE